MEQYLKTANYRQINRYLHAYIHMFICVPLCIYGLSKYTHTHAHTHRHFFSGGTDVLMNVLQSLTAMKNTVFY